MSTKKKILLASVIVASAVGLILHHRDFHGVIPGKRLPTAVQKADSVSEPSMNLENPAASSLAVNPWDYHKPLTADERREFEGAEAQVQKFVTWGKIDPEAVPAFQQTLFKMGERGIADLARELSQITREDLLDKAAAEAVVHKIDTLAYFADSTRAYPCFSSRKKLNQPARRNPFVSANLLGVMPPRDV